MDEDIDDETHSSRYLPFNALRDSMDYFPLRFATSRPGWGMKIENARNSASGHRMLKPHSTKIR